MTRIAVVGGGKIGEALIRGLHDSGTSSRDIVLVEADEARASELSDRYDILATDLEVACEGADVIVVAVKPHDVPAVVSRIGEYIQDSVKEAILVSLAAGVPIEALEASLAAGSPVVRVMPNMAMIAGEGTSAISGGRFAKQEHVDQVTEMMDTVGRSVIVAESQMHAVTAISGSGPAYFFLLAEAMIDAAVQQGLSRPLATELVNGTARGAGFVLGADEDGPVDLRAAVSSPGGTTAAAIRQLERGGLRSALYDAVEAAATRSRELAAAALPQDEDDLDDED